MKSKIALFSIAILIVCGFSFAKEDQPATTKTYKVNTEKSKLHWKGKKLVGYSHDGIIKLSEGEIVRSDSAISKGHFVIDMNTILDHEAMEDPSFTDLTDHLKSADFFDVEKYPTAILEITGAKPIRNNPDAGDKNYIITADLTLKGVTKKIAFPATLNFNEEMFTAKAHIVIDRSKWNVRYGSGSFFDDMGDEMIDDDIELDVDIVAEAI